MDTTAKTTTNRLAEAKRVGYALTSVGITGVTRQPRQDHLSGVIRNLNGDIAVTVTFGDSGSPFVPTAFFDCRDIDTIAAEVLITINGVSWVDYVEIDEVAPYLRGVRSAASKLAS